MPSALVEFGDSQCGKDEIVGEKNELLLSFGIEVFYTAEFLRITRQRFGRDQHYCLVVSKANTSIHRMGIDSPDLGVFLGPRNEEGKKLSKNIESFKVQVTAIHDVERSWFRNYDVKDIDIMERSLGNLDERGDVAAKIQEGMHFDGSFMLAERRPREKRQAKVNGSGIQSIGGFFELDAEVFIGIKGACLRNQNLAEVGIHSPVPFFIRLSKGASRYSAPDAKVIQLLLAGTEASFNIPKTFPVSKLGEAHT